jgi:REP element-mobilizing transposase RayT
MPQSLAYVIVHLVFSTKDRKPLLEKSIRPKLHAYLASIVRNTDCECYRVGGTADHVHLAIRLSRTTTISNLIEELKISSSKWLKIQSPKLGSFAWQRGYGAFSVRPMDRKKVIAYIDKQEIHHRTQTFQEEFRTFLEKYGIAYDDCHVWD